MKLTKDDLERICGADCSLEEFNELWARVHAMEGHTDLTKDHAIVERLKKRIKYYKKCKQEYDLDIWKWSDEFGALSLLQEILEGKDEKTMGASSQKA